MSDLLEQLADLTREPYAGPAPLHFTGAYFTPDELLAAHVEAARVVGRGTHTWNLAITLGWCAGPRGHSLCVLSTDLRCNCRMPYLVAEWEQLGPCQCVGDYLYQANCPECRWHVIASEPVAVEAWHDHAWPGWRELPVVPYALCDRTGGMDPKSAIDKKRAAKARAWVEANYPTEWQVEGAPVLTERTSPGTRNVPGYSPWGGFDICGRVVEP